MTFYRSKKEKDIAAILPPRELADEALQALREAPMTPREHFEFLIQRGIVDRNGRVLVAKLFGSNGDQTPQATAPIDAAPAD